MLFPSLWVLRSRIVIGTQYSSDHSVEWKCSIYVRYTYMVYMGNERYACNVAENSFDIENKLRYITVLNASMFSFWYKHDVDDGGRTVYTDVLYPYAWNMESRRINRNNISRCSIHPSLTQSQYTNSTGAYFARAPLTKFSYHKQFFLLILPLLAEGWNSCCAAATTANIYIYVYQT